MQRTNSKQRLTSAGVAALAAIGLASTTHAAVLTWDGGGADSNWTTDANWLGDPATGPSAGDTLVFDGSTQLNSNNDVTGLTLASASGATAFSFAASAGAYSITGNSLTVGLSTGDVTLLSQSSAANQLIQNNLSFAGGGRSRFVAFTATSRGSVTFGGNVNFSNDAMTIGITNPGTMALLGSNSGDGRGNQIAANGNQLRGTILNTSTDNNRLVLGNDTALGNSGTGSVTAGTATLKGIYSSRHLYISTANGDRNLSGSTFGVAGGRIEFDGANHLSIGNVINSGGNRDLWVTGTGALTVASNLFLSNDQTGRSMYVNVTGAGGMTVNGAVYDSFYFNPTIATYGILRKAGVGTLTLNGDSAFKATVQVEGGTLKVGHANALGSSLSTDFTSIRAGTLDLNGFTISEKLTIDNASAILANSSATSAAVATDVALANNLTVNATGDITVTRLVGNANRVVTKLGAGTLTTSGSGHNNLTAWNIQAGTVVFANTAGLGADRGVTLNGGVLRLSGENSDLVNNSEAFVLNAGAFDLNGKGEAVAAIDGGGGVVTNSSASAAALYVGGGVGGASSGSYGGVIQDGTGVLNLTKEGSGTQTLTAGSTYTGDTSVSAGTLALAAGASFMSGNIGVASGATLSFTSGDSLADSATLRIADGGLVNLAGLGTETIGQLDLGGTVHTSGTFGSAGSGAENESSYFTGTGVISVPEPSAAAALGVVGWGLLGRRRRRC